MSEQQIHNEIMKYIHDDGQNYGSWYVGISSDPRKRLFIDHNVQEKDSWWIYRKAESPQNARNVEEFIINKYKTDGGIGGGDEFTKYVYAYKKIESTKP